VLGRTNVQPLRIAEACTKRGDGIAAQSTEFGSFAIGDAANVQIPGALGLRFSPGQKTERLGCHLFFGL
jgi:hypothetical protein